MEVRNALQIKKANGKTEKRGFNSFTQPIQFLPKVEKDPDWCMHNMDWYEWQGVKQIGQSARRLMKNYKLAKGVIDREDYIDEPAVNDVSELIEMLGSDPIAQASSDSAMSLKFYPIIPTLINVMVAEFAKRNTKIDFRAVDEFSYNEIMDAKAKDIEAALLEDATIKLTQKMVAMGMDPNSEEAQQQLNPDALKKLPEIEEFYSKNFQTIGEQWASKQHTIDVARFHMEELEEIAFRDMLITDREFWHFKMLEDDYSVELWNPVLTFYHKSPDVRYISEGNWVGKIDMLTISDVIDLYGPRLNTQQLSNLETLHPVKAGRHMLDGVPNDGSFYDSNIPHEKNLSPSLQMKRWLSFSENVYNPEDVVAWIVGESEHTGLLHDNQMLRVTTAYWKTQRKLGYLTSIGEGGEVFNDIIDENYVVSNNPIYNTKFNKKRIAETLVFGDHIEWIWINQVYGGVKIGPNRMMFQDTISKDEFAPIYIGIDQNEIGPLRFQFKNDQSLYGCKLPVEGKVFTERNTKSTAPVDLLKPAQVGYNLVNNQIADILIDEIGTVIALDQNALPKKSLGEDWGHGNYAKAYAAMKDFSILPLDTSITNTENALSFSHYQTLNLEQSARLMSRIQMANFFKQQALEVIGITPQRLGQQLGQTETARGVEQAVAGSYSQTEMYYVQHSDYLMPRVHQMRTDLAQFYHSKKPSFRLQSSVTDDERKFFEINGVDLLLVDIHVYCKTNANGRAIMDRMLKMVEQNNTSGATIYELGELMQADSLGTLSNKMKALDQRAQERAQNAAQQEQADKEAELEAKKLELQMTLDAKARENEKDRRNELMVAEIRAAGYGSMQDLNANQQSDFQDTLETLKDSEEYQDTMNFNREKEGSKKEISSRKLDIEEKKLDLMREQSANNIRIARENTTASEIKAKKKK